MTRFQSATFALCFLISTISASSGTIAVFSDLNCVRVSVVNPTVHLPANTCLVSPNAESVSVRALPACLSGSAKIATYRDTSCSNPMEEPDFMVEKNCYSDGTGAAIKAIQFVCPEVDSGSEPTSTTTATFGSSLIPIASDTPSPRSETQPTVRSSSRSMSTSEPTASPAALTSSSAALAFSPAYNSPTATPTSGSGNRTGDSPSGSGISRDAQIGIGIGVPVVALIVAVLAWWFPCKKGRRPRQRQYNNMIRELPSTGPSLQHSWTALPSPLQDLSNSGKNMYR